MSCPKLEELPFFVYGTLRCGELNYQRLVQGRTVSEAAAYITNAYLLNLGRFPMMLEPTAPATVAGLHPPAARIRGDLLFVHPRHYSSLLAELDMLEGYYPDEPQASLYLRVRREVLDEQGQPVTAWVYVGNPSAVSAPCAVIPGGDWVLHRRELRRSF